MKVYFYHRGNFTELKIDWPEGMEWDAWLTSQGFNAYSIEGNDISYEIHTASDKCSLGSALFAFGDSPVVHVIAEDGLDYLDLYARWVPAFQGSDIVYRLQNIETAINRAFHAWHGHDSQGFCNSCDPLEHRRWLDASAR